ncbi:MAG TPA: leucine--tRNA ligase [Candidatus Saccharimonadales bacterium]|nr:leucine--tRNA ligase [Candidatus Saccharimonadales bacterium]
MKRYNPKEIEPKWQQKWTAANIYEASEDAAKPKRYILEYFPYPSGAAMHVGHVRNYTIGDALARFTRMRGYNVLHPMGWDAFGLPAENYAIKTGISPAQAIKENTGKFKQQLTQMGFSYDWSREFASSDPEYYKWTQWFFLLLYKRGLAYRQESLQWWCPVDKTVLANEQVEAGRCWRCGSEVDKKALKQWFFKITEYANRLEKDLDDVDWSESIKAMQRNWIGRSKGAEINFAVEGSDEKIPVFTTRPDTIYGATFLVLAPEHPMVPRITKPEHRAQVENYIAKTRSKSDIERQETNREKTGIFTGAYVASPVNGEKIPVWISDYVLVGYGTGAIMAVPAHDERDHDFAVKFELPIVPVITPIFHEYEPDATDRRSANIICYDPETDRYCGMKWHTEREKFSTSWPGGGVDENETLEEGALREFTEETGYDDVIIDRKLPAITSSYYRNGYMPLQRSVRHVFMATLQSHHQVERNQEDYEKGAYDILWLTKEEALERMTDSWKMMSEFAFNMPIHVGEGSMTNSGPYDNMLSQDVREKIVADLAEKGVAKERINYKMRDWLISRQRYWGAPIPMVHCEKDGIVPVPEDQLPVMLPEMKSFESSKSQVGLTVGASEASGEQTGETSPYAPSGDGRSPLARVPEFVNTTCPKCGGPAERETDTMDGFACSSWYFWRFIDPHNDKQAFDPEKVKRWAPVDDYIGGAEHAVMHLLYVRMWTKVMYDAGILNFDEPIKSLRNHGMILAPDGQKMSKSKGNVIAPDELIEQGYGADAIRIMELFIGPWNQAANWSVEGMGGAFRFLQRVWNVAQDLQATAGQIGEQTPHEKDIRRVMHRTIKKVSEDLESLSFNTAIAAMMEAVNELYKIKAKDNLANADAWRWAIETLLQLLAPFAPHITEELWAQLGHDTSIHVSEWPTHDEQYLVDETMTIVVQVNGKVRAQLSLPADASESDVVAAAKAHEKVQPQLAQGSKKTIYVPKKLVNFVV